MSQDGATLHRGTVKWFSIPKGYGFIVPSEGGDDVFFHYSVVEGASEQRLWEGDEVQFEQVDAPRGPKAARVWPTGDAAR